MGEIEKLNLGVDMTLLESMDITIDYFKEDRSGILCNVRPSLQQWE